MQLLNICSQKLHIKNKLMFHCEIAAYKVSSYKLHGHDGKMIRGVSSDQISPPTNFFGHLFSILPHNTTTSSIAIKSESKSTNSGLLSPHKIDIKI